MLATKADDTATDLLRRQIQTASMLLGTVVVLDQVTKWWGWRFAPKAIINSGSTWFIGGPVGGWFSGPVSGPLLDLLNVVLLSLAGFVLVRRLRRPLLLVAGSLMIAGWSSNVLDRLGLHSVTAPDSVRGAIDFIPVGPAYCNVADVFITLATVLYVVAALDRRGRARHVAGRVREMSAVSLPTWGPRLTWLAATGFVVAVALTVPDALTTLGDSGTLYVSGA